MSRPKTKLEKWPQLNVRVEPSLHRALVAALHNPLYLRLPTNTVQDFVNAAIKHELDYRGLPCAIPYSSSTTPTGKPLTENSSGLNTTPSSSGKYSLPDPPKP